MSDYVALPDAWTEVQGIPTTWSFTDVWGKPCIPTVQIGSLRRTVLDIILDGDALVYLDLLTAGHQQNRQEMQHIQSALSAAIVGTRYGNLLLEGYTVPHRTGAEPPERWKPLSPVEDRIHTPQRVHERFGVERGVYYTPTVMPHPTTFAMEVQFLQREALQEPRGYWIIPLALPQAQREQLWREEVLRRCPSVVVAPGWARWLYAFCREDQVDSQGHHVTMCRPLRSYGRFQGFCVRLDEITLRRAISVGIRSKVLTVAEGEPVYA
jgi:hypothetical protein